MRTFEERLDEALRKEREGRGLKNSEITLLQAFKRGQLEPRAPVSHSGLRESDTRASMTAGRDTLQQTEGEPGAPGAPGGYTEGAAVAVVTADGRLVDVVLHSSAGAPSGYPTVLKTENGGVTVKLDGDGVQVFNSNYLIEMNAAGAAVVFRKNSGPYSITFDLSALLRDLAIRVDDYCESGVDMSQTHLGSDPH